MPKITQGHSGAKTRAWASVLSPAPGTFRLVIQPEAPNICKTDGSRVESKGSPFRRECLSGMNAATASSIHPNAAE